MSDSCCNSDSQQGNMCNSIEVLNRDDGAGRRARITDKER